MHLIFRSVFLNILILLLVFELAVQIFQPVGWVRSWNITSGWLPRKLPKLINSDRKANVVLTGSSLFLYPAVRCDEQFEKKRSRYDRYYVETVIDLYSDARYFEHLLSEKVGKPMSVINLATAGALMSDQYLVLQKWLERHEKPDYLVVDVSPREFIDNNLETIENSPVCKVLAEKFSIWEILQANAAASGGWGQLFKLKSNFYRDRSEYREAIVSAVCRYTGYQTNLYYATAGGALDAADHLQEKTEKPLDRTPIYEFVDGPREAKSYLERYTPLNMPLYHKEIYFFERFLSLAHSKNIKVYLIVMPLRQENSKLLPLTFKEKFAVDIAALAKKYQAELVIPAAKHEFGDADFEGFAHLNALGGGKLYTSIVEAFSPNSEH